MARADVTLSTESQSGSEGCSSDSVQCLATHLCYAKSKAVCSFGLQLSLHSMCGGCLMPCFSLSNIMEKEMLWLWLRKRYVNPYDRMDSMQQAEELKKVNEENNLSLSSRSAMFL